MKWLITGIEGFVATHFSQAIKELNQELFATSIFKERVNDKNVFLLDLTNKEEIIAIVKKIRPDYLVLLAGFSSMRQSFEKPEECLAVNYHSSRFFLEAIRQEKLNTKVLLISSAMVYAPSLNKVDESYHLENTSPYAESKIKQERLIEEFPDIDIVCSRSFNHTGPGQMDIFLVPKLVNKFVQEQGEVVELSLGDINCRRDFLDVRDVCKAYITLLENDTKHKIYNVCSSQTFSVEEIISLIAEQTKKRVAISKDLDFSGKNERPIIWGDNSLICQDTCWKPLIPFEQTIKDMCEFKIREMKNGQ